MIPVPVMVHEESSPDLPGAVRVRLVVPFVIAGNDERGHPGASERPRDSGVIGWRRRFTSGNEVAEVDEELPLTAIVCQRNAFLKPYLLG